MSEPELCEKNPRKKPCCMHKDSAVDHRGEWTTWHTCCWCGRCTEKVVTFVPDHGPHTPVKRK